MNYIPRPCSLYERINVSTKMFPLVHSDKNRLRRLDLETLYCSLKAHLRSSAPISPSEMEDGISDGVITQREQGMRD